MNARTLIGAVLALLTVSSGVVGLVSATPTDDRTDDEHPDAAIDRHLAHLQERFDLSDAQVEELHTLITRMHEQGASRAEIKRAVIAKLVEWDKVEERDVAKRLLKHLQERFDLTDEQTRELATMATRMHENGASRDEIKRAIYLKLVAWEKVDGHRADHIRAFQAEFDLSGQQVHEILSTVTEMRQGGATHAEIREAVGRQLVSYGADPADVKEAYAKYRIHRLAERFDLTEEETRIVAETVRDGVAAGDTPAEIREDVRALLESWGKLDGDRATDRPVRETTTDRPADASTDTATPTPA
ncbi:hypothetical protein [Natronomonas sp. EA1]|uniref:hypothetical protein n=1 Tax=Natronomonas sp. EA1 TaxID=3421655 RepID=UPI003EBB795B